MKTSLNKIRDNHPCKDSWEKLLKYLGKTKADDDELSILTILDSNGIEDAIWCLRAVDGHDDEINAFARFCAKQNVEKIKPYCTEEAYTLILNWLETGKEDIKLDTGSAARSVTKSTVWSMVQSMVRLAERSVTRLAERSAVQAAADPAAWSAAWSAAWLATQAARAARAAQTTQATRTTQAAAWATIEKELRRLLKGEC